MNLVEDDYNSHFVKKFNYYDAIWRIRNLKLQNFTRIISSGKEEVIPFQNESKINTTINNKVGLLKYSIKSHASESNHKFTLIRRN